MSGQCPLGNRGFPIVVNGVTSNVVFSTSPTKIATQRPNDIKLNFIPTTISPLRDGSGRYDVQGSQSFNLGGSQYMLDTMRICQSFPNGVEYDSKPVAELHLWGKPPVSATPNSSAECAVLIIPIYSASSSTNEAVNFVNIIQNGPGNLSKIFPQNTEVFRYNTCVEFPDGNGGTTNKTIGVAYWRKGMGLAGPLPTLPTFGIPIGLTLNKPVYSIVSEVGAAATRTLSGSSNPIDSVSRPYITTISASSSDFSTRFSYCIFIIDKSVSETNGPTQYKCIAIDRQKDIVNGQVMVDPKTGKRLADSLKEDDDEQAELDAMPTPTISGGDIEKKLEIAFGVLGGTILLALVIWFISSYITKKNSADAAAAAATAAATAALPTIHWLDLALPGFLGIVFTMILTIIITSFVSAAKT
jgi:hypothetical protein